MPDVVITGHKKCGTMAMLAFLIRHPKIVGTSEEYHWKNTWDFNHDFKAFLGHISINNKNVKIEKGTFLVTKTGNAAIRTITEKAFKLEPSIGSGFTTKYIISHIFSITFISYRNMLLSVNNRALS